jgi:hypothetical protein
MTMTALQLYALDLGRLNTPAQTPFQGPSLSKQHSTVAHVDQNEAQHKDSNPKESPHRHDASVSHAHRYSSSASGNRAMLAIG